MRRRRGGVGLLGTMAVGGVAYAAGSSAARGQANEAAQSAQIAELQSQVESQNAAAQFAAPTPGTPPMGAPSTMDDKLAQLQKLSELRSAGVITDEDVAVQKARILAT